MENNAQGAVMVETTVAPAVEVQKLESRRLYDRLLRQEKNEMFKRVNIERGGRLALKYNITRYIEDKAAKGEKITRDIVCAEFKIGYAQAINITRGQMKAAKEKTTNELAKKILKYQQQHPDCSIDQVCTANNVSRYYVKKFSANQQVNAQLQVADAMLDRQVALVTAGNADV